MPLVPEVPAHAPMTIDDDTGAHWRPALRGAYVLFTDPATPPSPPTENVALEHAFAFRLLDPASPVSVARIVPFWQRIWDRSAVHWLLQGGQYTMTPDHRPLIGPTAVEGLYVNSGYSGHGIMGSAAGSRLLVDVLTGKTANDENPFRVDRTFVHRELDRL
jgi:sarcosine oxidase subunit beta